MKYCRKCGTQVQEGIRYCPNCGTEFTKTSQEAPPQTQVKFCRACAKEVPADAKFCRFCGYRFDAALSDGASTPIRGTAAGPAAENTGALRPAAQVQKDSSYEKIKTEKETHRGSGSTAGRRGGKRAAALVLAAAVFAVTAFRYPGFLVRDHKPEETTYAVPAAGMDGALADAKTVMEADAKTVVEADEDEAPLLRSADELPLRYTPGQLDSAPVRSAQVGPEQGSVVLGDVTVEIPSWELEEDDRIEVRELPELSQGTEGWSVRAYDFSLASGIHEFDSDIRLTIPREGSSGFSGCVWYNEDSGRWEDVYSEVSADGKYYTVYTDHFSLFGEKKYRFDEKRLDLVVDDESRRINLKDGIFIECLIGGRPRMESEVMVDYERMWNMFQNKNLEHVADIGNTIALLNKDPNEIASLTDSGFTPVVDTVGDIFGLTSTSDGALWVAAGMMGNKSPAPDAMGQCFTIMDTIMTGYKVYAEAKSDKTNTYGTALMNSIMNHKLDVASTTFGVAATFAPAAWNPVVALIGLSLYAVSQAYTLYYENGIEEWNTKYYPDEGEVFRRFYQASGVRLFYETPEIKEKAARDYHVVIMSRPANMDNKKFQELKTLVNDRQKGIRTDSYRGFAPVFAKLIELYADDPKGLETVIDDFFYSVATAIWQVPNTKAKEKNTSPQVDFLNDYLSLGKDPYLLKRTEQLKLSEAYVMKLKVDTAPILENVAGKIQRKGCEELMRRINKELLPVLNRVLVFRVEDGALAPGQSFADSVYCVDWQTINSNRKYLSLPDEEGSVFDEGFTAPMRFEFVNQPKFLPLDYDGRVLSERNYYPYTPNFIPRPEKNTDIVFRCTYFHYLMMGAPGRMIFLDRKTGKEVKADIVIPRIDPKESRNTRSTDVYIQVNGRPMEIPSISASLLYSDVSIPEQSPKSKVTVSPSGEVTFTLAALDDLRLSRASGAQAEKDYEIYDRPAMTLKGRVTDVDPNGFAYTSDVGTVSKIGSSGTGGSSAAKAPATEDLIIIRGFLTGSPGGFEDRHVYYYDGKMYRDDRYQVSKVGIAPAGYSGRNDNFAKKGYSSFVIWQSKETGAVAARICFRGDVSLRKMDEPAKKEDEHYIWLDGETHCPHSLEITW